jgi:hypothetical protein
MTKKSILIATLMTQGLCGIAFAKPKYELGSNLVKMQISQLGTLISFNVGSETFRILPDADDTGVYVINDHGKVGKCSGEILISGVSIDEAKKALEVYQSKITSIQVYDGLKMVSAKFRILQDAAKVKNELASTLAGATITLPIEFNQPRPQ